MASASVQDSMQAWIEQAAPELSDEFSELWSQYQPAFEMTEDRGDFRLEAGSFGLVVFTPRTIMMAWILAHEAWAAMEGFGPQLWLLDRLRLLRFQCVRRRFGLLLRYPSDQAHAESRIDVAAKELQTLTTSPLAQYRPPPWLAPLAGRPHDKSSAAVYDLACIAIAALFLHEVQHVRHAHSGWSGSEWEAELDCDAYAINMLLKRVADYARIYGVDERRVRSKRAIGLAVAMYVVCRLTNEERAAGSQSHPPLGERVARLSDAVDLPSRSTFWKFFASTLLAELRGRRKLPASVQATDLRALCAELANLLP